jgi:hypothetical protein
MTASRFHLTRPAGADADVRCLVTMTLPTRACLGCAVSYFFRSSALTTLPIWEVRCVPRTPG